MTGTRNLPDLSNLDAMLLDPSQRHLEPRAGMIGHCRMFSQAKSIDRDNRTIDFVCSTGTVDRYGEIVEPEAFRDSLPDFMRNPAMPFGHFYDAVQGQTPTVGHWKDMRVESAALVGKAWFKPRGMGEECWQDYLEGNLTSVSVAFLTREWAMRDIGSGAESRRVRVFTKVDLIECSPVLIPANPQARLRAASFLPATGASGGDNATMKQLQNLIERLEYIMPSDDPDGHQSTRSNGNAAGSDGREDYRDLGYFSDAPNDDPPGDRSAPQGENDPELKAALRDLKASAAGA